MSESIHLESQLTMSPAVWQCSQTGSESITVIESSEKLRWGEIGGIAGGVVVLAAVIWLQFLEDVGRRQVRRSTAGQGRH
jgi:hypothetical protein